MPKKSTIPVYKAERKDGIADTIQANASIAYVTQLQDLKLSQEVAREFLASVGSQEDQEQFDLYYLNTILVTTGWNKNYDVFPADETWAARYTPIHKQFNLEHDQSKIIGHMTTAKAVSEDFSLISEDTSIDDLPAKFHIMTGAVIYRALSDETAQENINKIIEEIEAGEWYVSMECLFRGFDYALTSSAGEKRFLARNEETAFLTKHLRQYGGSGQYKDFVLGRALKNITFSGKGLVRKPANPESIIFNQAVSDFNTVYASLGYITSSENLITEGNKEMPNDNSLEAKVAELTEANKVLNEKIKTHEESATTAKITSLEAEKASLTARISELENENTGLKSAKADLDTKLTETVNEVKALKDTVASLNADKVKSERIALLVGKNAPKEQAESLVKLFADKNDADFATIVDLFAPQWTAKPSEAPPETVPETNVDPEPDASLSASSTNTDIENTRKAMAAVLGSMINTKIK